MKKYNKLTKCLLIAVLATFSLSSCSLKDKKTSDSTTEATVTTEATTEVTTEATTDKATASDASLKDDIESKLNLKDGTYSASFDTDSSMFHINEAYDGKGILTVKDGVGTMHIVFPSQRINQLFFGVSEDAQKDGAKLIQPTIEKVTYSDGSVEEVNSFDIPVPYLDKEFDLALIGDKGTWYDHKVKVSKPMPANEASANDASETDSAKNSGLDDDQYLVPVTLEGGSGKATVDTPTLIQKTDTGYLVTLTWSSPNYDYMIVDGEKYLPVNTEGKSVFEIPFSDLSAPVNVIADTVAMSKPHEIEYTLTFDMSEVE
ncbi:MAG: iron transporter [Eubacterium sp.]|nr:iron transporter [Eubacterium sp.]